MTEINPEELVGWGMKNQLIDLLTLRAKPKRHLEPEDWNTGGNARLVI